MQNWGNSGIPQHHRSTVVTRKDEEKSKTGLLLRELEWFEVETRIRQFVYELIDPKLQTMMRDRQKVDNFQSVLDAINERIRSLDDVFYQNEQKMSKFDIAMNRVSEIKKELEIFKLDLEAKSERIDAMREESEQQFNMLHTTTSQMNLQADRIALNMDQSIQETDRFRKDILSLMSAHNDKHTRLQEESYAFLNSEKDKTKKIYFQLDLLQEKLDVKAAADEAQLKFTNELECKILTLSDDFHSLQNSVQEQTKVLKSLTDIREQTDKLQASLAHLSYYVDKNIPLNTYAQITECVFPCVPPERVKAFVDADDKQFKVLNQRLVPKHSYANAANTIQPAVPPNALSSAGASQIGQVPTSAVTSVAAAVVAGTQSISGNDSLKPTDSMFMLKLSNLDARALTNQNPLLEISDLKDSTNFFTDKIAAIVKRNQKAKKTYKNKEMQQLEELIGTNGTANNNTNNSNSNNNAQIGSASLTISPVNPAKISEKRENYIREDSADSKITLINNNSSTLNNNITANNNNNNNNSILNNTNGGGSVGGFLSSTLNLPAPPPLIRPFKSFVLNSPISTTQQISLMGAAGGGGSQSVRGQYQQPIQPQQQNNLNLKQSDFILDFEDGIAIANANINGNDMSKISPNIYHPMNGGSQLFIPVPTSQQQQQQQHHQTPHTLQQISEMIRAQMKSDDYVYTLDSLIEDRFGRLLAKVASFEKQITKAFSELEENNSLAIENFNEKTLLIQSASSNLHSTLTNTLSVHTRAIQAIEDRVDIFDNCFKPIDSNLFHLNQITMLLYQLVVQDEKDKQSMGLFGLKDPPLANDSVYNQSTGTFGGNGTSGVSIKQSQPNSTGIRLEEKCLSCSGQGILLNQYFKLACLAYKPQPLSIDGKEYTRVDLLKVCSKIATQLKQINLAAFEQLISEHAAASAAATSPRLSTSSMINTNRWSHTPSSSGSNFEKERGNLSSAILLNSSRPKSTSMHGTAALLSGQQNPTTGGGGIIASVFSELKTLPTENDQPAYAYDEKLDNFSILAPIAGTKSTSTLIGGGAAAAIATTGFDWKSRRKNSLNATPRSNGGVIRSASAEMKSALLLNSMNVHVGMIGSTSNGNQSIKVDYNNNSGSMQGGAITNNLSTSSESTNTELLAMSSTMPNFIKLKTRKVIAKKSSMPTQYNTTSTHEGSHQQNHTNSSKEKINSFEKRRQFIMKSYAPPQTS